MTSMYEPLIRYVFLYTRIAINVKIFRNEIKKNNKNTKNFDQNHKHININTNTKPKFFVYLW